MPRLFKLVGTPAICLALFALMGGQWAVLQAVAWSQMVIEYSEETRSVISGIEQTFSGEFPCGLCKSIAKAKHQESEKAPMSVAGKKVEILAVRIPAAVSRPLARPYSYPASADSRLASRRDAPPQPVPIQA